MFGDQRASMADSDAAFDSDGIFTAVRAPLCRIGRDDAAILNDEFFDRWAIQRWRNEGGAGH